MCKHSLGKQINMLIIKVLLFLSVFGGSELSRKVREAVRIHSDLISSKSDQNTPHLMNLLEIY